MSSIKSVLLENKFEMKLVASIDGVGTKSFLPNVFSKKMLFITLERYLGHSINDILVKVYPLFFLDYFGANNLI